MNQENSAKNVVVLGASPKPERYSNQAVVDLLKYGHQVFPVHPLAEEIHGQACYTALDKIDQAVNTITLYVGAARSDTLAESIFALKPKRLIMNPGAENDKLEAEAEKRGIEVVRGCTLVMLRTQQF
ncbi:CoA-binding protein [Candidatus Venteria ishoeyi]|uniref:CoA-binding domain-containing protein n=1 Tax=Candidatus Venteria ishoeyi TaxID=1899563 RepID=A0A1H6FCC2_9GAMM|nr:CoA-binding protein [Candidatus Venteria ishoeyi]MDM8545527.1 CoA-binding protein [Candidatus Venteria ishoeyi]SEH07041.1 Uncharacterised protein [Candidatus Venteria ishoeyi]